MRRLFSTALLSAAIITFAAPADAGDAQLAPSRVRVDAGAQIELTAHISADSSRWIAEGPYYAYLSGRDFGTVLTTVRGGAATDAPVGKLSIEATSAGTQVVVIVSIPEETPPGEYQIVVCNDPCTTGAGDLTGGPLYVGVDPPGSGDALQTSPTIAVDALATSTPPSSATATTVYLALGQHPERTTQMSPLWIAFSAALGAAVLVTALFSRNRG